MSTITASGSATIERRDLEADADERDGDETGGDEPAPAGQLDPRRRRSRAAPAAG